MDEQTVFNALSGEQKEIASQLKETFQTKGWTLVVSAFEQLREAAHQSAAYAQSWDQNQQARGAEIAYAELVNFEASSWAIAEQAASDNIVKQAEFDDTESQS